MTVSMMVANWKMHGAHGLADQLLKDCAGFSYDVSRFEGVLMLPHVYLDRAQRMLHNTAWQWGGQNCHHLDAAAQTGEVSPSMLAEFGCSHVLIGHSERRTHVHEQNSWLKQKWLAAVAAGLVPILCVGESAAQRDAGEAKAVVAAQLNAIFSDVVPEAYPARWIVAYEPIWAIGTGRVPACEEIEAMHQWIQQILIGFSARHAQQIRLLYGGSVNRSNVQAILALQHVQGALIGGASLDSKHFFEMMT